LEVEIFWICALTATEPATTLFEVRRLKRVPRTMRGAGVPPAFFFVILAAILIFYVLAVEGMKQWFFRRFAAE
jgi:hypothetical protein